MMTVVEVAREFAEFALAEAEIVPQISLVPQAPQNKRRGIPS